MKYRRIRQATASDAFRIAEIEVFSYRLSFYPIFKNDKFYFEELQVSKEAEKLLADEEILQSTYVYDDGVVKGFIIIDGGEVWKLFVEPALQGQSIGAELLEYAKEVHSVNSLWVLEKNVRAIKFYRKHGFCATEEKIYEEGTTEYLVRMKLSP